MLGRRDARFRAPKRPKISLFVYGASPRTSRKACRQSWRAKVKIKLTSVYVDGGHLGQ